MSVAAGILVGLCQLALEGADKLVGQLNSPALSYIRGSPWRLGVRHFDPFFIDIFVNLSAGVDSRGSRGHESLSCTLSGVYHVERLLVHPCLSTFYMQTSSRDSQCQSRIT